MQAETRDVLRAVALTLGALYLVLFGLPVG